LERRKQRVSKSWGHCGSVLNRWRKNGKESEVFIPEPVGELNVEEKEGLSVVKLSRLIEMKIASGIGNPRRTHKDFADVVELIAICKLDGSFSRYLHASIRPTFRELV